MERIVLLLAIFIVGYLLISSPTPIVLSIDITRELGAIMDYLLGLVGYLMMLYATYSLIKLSLQKK
ncbi:hypothetical protein ACFO9Q_03230 [Paenibacillus sp. GCM10023252]|uniref:hypothetical protein n=1 Tax=Paenibacillus sp. GCM10023252 TaxID=3252649 RepID=UPI0036099527